VVIYPQANSAVDPRRDATWAEKQHGKRVQLLQFLAKKAFPSKKMGLFCRFLQKVPILCGICD
jgi:hypothetical protein